MSEIPTMPLDSCPHIKRGEVNGDACATPPPYSLTDIVVKNFGIEFSEALLHQRDICIQYFGNSSFDDELDKYVRLHEEQYGNLDIDDADKIDTIDICIADIFYVSGNILECTQVLKNCTEDLSHSGHFNAYRQTNDWLMYLHERLKIVPDQHTSDAYPPTAA